MDWLKVLIVMTSAMAMAPGARADDLQRWRPMIAQASTRFSLPAAWIEKVMMAESRGQTHINGRPIRSRAGAMGLMQLMPVTWSAMQARLNLGSDPDDPYDNIVAGACYLRLMYDRFGYPGLFGAYNAGPARFAAVLAGRATLPGETSAYLAATAGGMTWRGERDQQPVSKDINGIFFSLGGR